MWPVQGQVKFFVPQATNSIWRRETRTMATPMRSLSVGVAKSVREWFLDRRGRGFDDCVHRRRSIAKSVQNKKYRNRSETRRMSLALDKKVKGKHESTIIVK